MTKKKELARLCNVFLLSLLWNVPVNAGFLCDKAAVLGAVIKERPCIMQQNSEYFGMWIGWMVTD